MAEPFEPPPTNDVLDENRFFFEIDSTDPKNCFLGGQELRRAQAASLWNSGGGNRTHKVQYAIVWWAISRRQLNA